MALVMGRSQKYFLQQQEHLGEINGHIEEILKQNGFYAELYNSQFEQASLR